MNLMKRFIGETEDGDIRRKLDLVLSQPAELGQRARFVKATLGLLQELTTDRD